MNKKTLMEKIRQDIADSKPSTPPTRPLPEPAQPSKPAATKQRKAPTSTPEKTPAAAGSSGRQAAFWLDDEDRQLFREFSMQLYTQGIKPSDNLILRAAIRLMPRDHRFTDQVNKLIAQDGRKLRHQKE